MNALWPLWLSALALLLLTLAGLLWPLLRESAVPAADNPDARERLRQIYRTQRAELEREHQRKSLTDVDYAQAVEELERRLLEDLNAVPAPALPAAEGVWRKRMPAAFLSVLLPAAAFVLYLQVGDPRAAATVALGTPDIHANTGADVEDMVRRLEERLRETPDNLEGWIVLARSREVLEDYAAAMTVYQRALDLAVQQKTPPELQARLYADMADAMASARGGALDKPVQAALTAALKLDAAQPKALALAGTAALREGDLAGARQYWQRLLKLLEPDSDMALRVQNDLARLEPGKPAEVKAKEAIAGLAGTVRLDPALQDRVEPGDTVFIVVRAPEIGRMPVAVLRLTVAQLPMRFTLDDRNAMSPDMPLSRFDELTIEARISRSGTAQRQPGQLISPLQTVRRGNAGLTLLIGAIEP
ncbi:Formate-dependent nitrite reductase complex subunit NrfG [compost metagenome]